MQHSLCGSEEDLVVGETVVTIPTPAGPVDLLVMEGDEPDEVKFHLDGSPEALAFVDADLGTSEKREAA